MTTIDVKDAGGATVAIEKPNANGRAAAAASRPVALSTEDLVKLDAILTKLSADPATQTTLAAILAALSSVAVTGPLTDGQLRATAVPVSVSGVATAANQATLISKDFATQTTLAALLAKVIAAPATEAKQDALNNLITTQNSYLDGLEGYVDGLEGQIGIVTETAPASDTASSGLNGRLQRIAQRLSSLIALVPAALTGNGGLKTGLVEALPAGTNAIGKVSIDTDLTAGEYETVAASSTDQAIGATGAAGDYLAGLLIVPATTSPGAVSIKDGAGSAITVFTGGASSVSNLVPFFIPLGLKSAAGAWKVTTGASVSAIASGNFT